MMPVARAACGACFHSITSLSTISSGGTWISAPSALENTKTSNSSRSSSDAATCLLRQADHRRSATSCDAASHGNVIVLAVRNEAPGLSLSSMAPWSPALGSSAWLSTPASLRHTLAASHSAAMCHTKAGSSINSNSFVDKEDRVPPQGSAGQGPAGEKTPGRGHSAGVDRWVPGGRGGGRGGKHSSGNGWHKGRAAQIASSKQRTAAITATNNPQQLLLVVQQNAADFDDINLSAAYTHAARLCRQGVAPQQQPAAVQPLLTELHQLAVRLQQQCGARELGNIIHSCSKLNSPDTAKLLLPAFFQASILQQASAQTMSNVAWAAATLQLHLTADEVQQLLEMFVTRLEDAAPQAVSNTLWGVATMGQKVPRQQMQQLLGRFESVLASAKPQEVSNTLWAVAKMGQHVPAQQLQQLLGKFESVLASAKPQEVSNTLWAVATMGQQVRPQQLQQLLSPFDNMLPATKPQHVSNLLWACGKMQYTPLPLLQSLQQQHRQQLQQLLAAATPQELANMAWACGQLGYRGRLLPDALLHQAVKLLQEGGTGSLNPQDMCNLCWSAAVLDLQQCVPQVLQLAAAASQVFSTSSEEELRQLHQVHLWLQDNHLPAPGQGLSGVLTQQQLEQCRASWEQQLTAISKQPPSRTQKSVYNAVLQLPHSTWQQQPQSEQPTNDMACVIDITALTASGVKVAIEVDGSHHYVQPDNTLSGPTLFRNRALAARGYALISIPYWEWEALHSPSQQQQYLLAKLQAVQQQHPDVPATPQPPAVKPAGAVEGGSSSRRRRRPIAGDPGNPTVAEL